MKPCTTMRTTITLLFLCLLLAHARAQNTCATAVAITTGTYTVDTIDGFEIPAPVCIPLAPSAAHGEWYSYTPPQDTAVTISTDLAANAGGDTRFHVYSGTCGALVCEGGDDDSGSGYLSLATLNLTGGVTYYIAFDDRWSASGFDFTLSAHAPVATLIGFTPVAYAASGYSACVVDMNGDHLDDIVSTSTTTITVHRQLAGGGFSDTTITTTPADHDASWSICAGDIDHNGYNDLMYGGGSGATFMFANANGTAFSEVSFADYIFCQRTNMVDLNSDGNLDAFSCHDVDANVWFLNDGSGNLSFNQGGMGENCGNYGSIWTDYDNDGDPDLFVAKCGCDPIDIMYRNNGDGTFTNIASPMGFADGQQSWSSAWGDFDNDGDMDAMVGSSAGSDHKLMRNDGTTFTNVTVGSGIDLFTGSNIEWTTHDFNNDGWLDVFGSNHILLNNGNMTFTPSLVNLYNGPIGDLNHDGFLDVVNGNSAYLNNGNSNHWLVVNTIGTASNWNGIGARVEVVSALGTQIRDVKSGDGFATMSSLNTYFGLGGDTGIDHVTIHWPSGIVDEYPAPAVNTVLVMVEGAHPVGIAEHTATLFGVHPNPTHDQLTITSTHDLSTARIRIMDAQGRAVPVVRLANGRIDVRALRSGVYVLQVDVNGRTDQQRFTKE